MHAMWPSQLECVTHPSGFLHVWMAQFDADTRGAVPMWFDGIMRCYTFGWRYNVTFSLMVLHLLYDFHSLKLLHCVTDSVYCVTQSV